MKNLVERHDLHFVQLLILHKRNTKPDSLQQTILKMQLKIKVSPPASVMNYCTYGIELWCYYN